MLKAAHNMPTKSNPPSGWEFVSLSELVTVLNGRAYKQNELLSTGTPVLRVGNLFTSDKWYYSDLELGDDKYCEAGDLIFAWSASFGPFIWTGERVIFHYHIWKLELHSDTDLDKNYLFKFLLQKTREIKEAGHGVSMLHMTKDSMERLVVALPPVAEQHRIVAKVDELMALCDKLETARAEREVRRDRLAAASLARLNAPDPGTFHDDARFALDAVPALTARADQLRQVREAVLRLAFCGRLSPTGTWPRTPSRLGEFARLQSGYAFKSEWFGHEGVRLVRNANVSHGILDWAQEARLPFATAVAYDRFQLKAGDIVLSLNRPFIGSGTKVAKVASHDLPALLVQRVGRFLISGELDNDYFLLWLGSSCFSSQLETVRTNVAPHIVPAHVEDSVLFVPSLPEQGRVVAKVHELMALCDRLQASLGAGDATRTRLLDALLQEALAPAVEIQEAA